MREVELPGIGTAAGFGGKRTDTETFYTLLQHSPRRRASIATTCSPARAACSAGAEVKFNPDDYEVEAGLLPQQGRHAGADVHRLRRKGLALDGIEPDAALRLRRVQHLAAAGRSRSAGWRGWRWAASTPSPTSAAAANMARRGTRRARSCTSRTSSTTSSPPPSGSSTSKYTRPDKLAIQGGSNGGLLVGRRDDPAARTVRRLPAGGRRDGHAAVPQVHRGPQLGRRLRLVRRSRSEFKALLAYSPYHNIRPGTRYPATLVTTADTDDRVVPGHSFKFAAALQHAQAGDAPVLIRISTRAGHGGGKPTAKRIEETADQWAFLVKNLGMKQ